MFKVYSWCSFEPFSFTKISGFQNCTGESTFGANCSAVNLKGWRGSEVNFISPIELEDNFESIGVV